MMGKASLCDVLEFILPHLTPGDAASLMRTSRGAREIVSKDEHMMDTMRHSRFVVSYIKTSPDKPCAWCMVCIFSAQNGSFVRKSLLQTHCCLHDSCVERLSRDFKGPYKAALKVQVDEIKAAFEIEV